MKRIVLLIALTLSAMLAVSCDDDEPSAPTVTPSGGSGAPTSTVPPNAEPGTPLPDDEPGTPVPDGSTDSFVIPASPDPAAAPALLVDVRVGAHTEDGGFDRIVFEFEDGQRPSGIVGYKDETAQCGSGMPVDPAGSHILAVHFDFTNAHTEAGELSIPSTTVSGPGNSILESEGTCDFEAVVEWAVGVDGEQPFTVTLLEAPNRVVIDVAH
ncbi:MAG TPA: hypothetical protein VFS30_18440 [Dehalococcoidia bacterium]|nr:hypothetical protein [Dehalococcoidia bacterium]